MDNHDVSSGYPLQPTPDPSIYIPSTFTNDDITNSLFQQYFPHTDDESVQPIQEIISRLSHFFSCNLILLDFNSIIEYGAVNIDFSDLYDTQEHKEIIPVGDFPTTLRTQPDVVLKLLAASIHIAVYNRIAFHDHYQTLIVRIRAYPIITPIQAIGSNLVGQYVSVKGTITRLGTVQPLVIEIPFKCSTCETEMVKLLPDGVYTLPTSCIKPNCRGRHFTPVYHRAKAIDWQIMIIQEIVDADSAHAGRIPPLLDCELTRDLISSFNVGDHVQVSGIVKARRPDNSRYGKKNIYVLYLDVNAIHTTTLLGSGGSSSSASLSSIKETMVPSFYDHSNSNNNNSISDDHHHRTQSLLAESPLVAGTLSSGLPSTQPTIALSTTLTNPSQQQQHEQTQQLAEYSLFEQRINQTNPLFCKLLKLYIPVELPPIMASGLSLTSNDLSMIAYIHAQPQLASLLINSICPNIYGHINVKMGILLSLLGGVRRDDDTGVTNRYNIHLLLVGEPGLGKSQLLRSVSQLTERGVYISGQGSSGAGLTATLVKEGKGFTLEPGALVIGDRGITCIDELDKLQHEHKSLLEAMEQQSISITKAGSICQLPARTTVIAAANPKGGTYDRSKSILENLKMSTALLSRFDLCYLMLDQGNREYDQLLSEHVISLHTGEGSKTHHDRLAHHHHQHQQLKQQANQQYKQQYGGSSHQLSSHAESAKKHSMGMGMGGMPPISNPPSKQEILEAFGHHIPFQQRYQVPLSSSSSSSSSSSPSGEHFDPIPPLLLKKYIAFAREYIKPVLSPTARNVIEEYFITLRKRSLGVASENSAVTTRQLESLIRLCEARAKLELRPISLSIDAYEVIDIMNDSMYRMFIDAHNVKSHTKVVGKKRGIGAMMRTFHDELIQLSQQQHRDLFTLHEMKELGKKLAIPPQQTMLIIDKLHNDCDLILKGNNTYKLIV